jgi:hypothetical protein
LDVAGAEPPRAPDRRTDRRTDRLTDRRGELPPERRSVAGAAHSAAGITVAAAATAALPQAHPTGSSRVALTARVGRHFPRNTAKIADSDGSAPPPHTGHPLSRRNAP